MAFYYVKSGGTATGDAGRYATVQTGSFASLGVAGYYDNILAAFSATTLPTSSDFILASDSHSHLYGANVQFNGPTSGGFVSIYSVADLNIDQYNAGADETTSDGFDFTFTGRTSWRGIELIAGDDVNIISQNVQVIVKDGMLGVNGSNDIVRLAGDGSSLVMINSNLMVNGSAASVDMSNAALLKMIGGQVTTNDRFLFSNWDSGGAKVKLHGVDLSQVSTYILRFVGASPTNDDLIDIDIDLCKMSASSPGFVEEEFTNLNHRFIATRSSSNSSNADYQYFNRSLGGDVNQDDTVFRNEDEPFSQSGQRVSHRINTTTAASISTPLTFAFPIPQYTELSQAPNDTLRFFLTSNTALTDKDIYIEVTYPDGTNYIDSNFVSSETSSPLGSGTALATDSTSTWTGGLTNNYQIDLDTSVDVGSDSQPIINVYVTIPSAVIHIASEYGEL